MKSKIRVENNDKGEKEHEEVCGHSKNWTGTEQVVEPGVRLGERY